MYASLVTQYVCSVAVLLENARYGNGQASASERPHVPQKNRERDRERERE